MEKNKITFIVAMESEARAIIQAFNLSEDPDFVPVMPMQAWTGSYEGMDISLVINGKDADTGLDLIGTQAATLATHFSVDCYKPALIINAGTAGAFKEKGADIGDVYLSRDYVVFHDRRVPIPGWDKQSIGYFPVWDISKIVGDEFPTGIISTGNSLDMPPEDEKNIRKLNADVKEMEAAAVAWVAQLHNVPFFCIKAVTDLVDSGRPTEDDFLHNLELANDHLWRACVRVVDLLKQNQK
ncbi:MAG: 5'-methylthioadenosine nucleosidase [Bacteroidota bacterium]